VDEESRALTDEIAEEEFMRLRNQANETGIPLPTLGKQILRDGKTAFHMISL
jgi:hypothetical protein